MISTLSVSFGWYKLMPFIPIGDVVKKQIRAAGIEPQVQGARIVGAFSEIAKDILGEHVAKKVQALYVKNATLTVAVLSSVVGQEIKLREREILDRLNAGSARPAVERIRFLV